MKKIYFILICLITSGNLFAQKIPFQGRLLDNGNPFTGTANIQFSITSPSWSETKNGVSVTDGYYSVVLGSTTPLPDTLFSDSREVTMNITVNGEALSPVTLHSPLLPFTGSNPIEIDSLVSRNLALQNSSGLDVVNIEGRDVGGFMLLGNPDPTDTYYQSFVMAGNSTNTGNAYLQLRGLNTTQDNATTLINNYNTTFDVFGAEFTGNYRRGGIDIHDNEGTFLAGIGSNRDESGGDPSGKSGLVIINGPTTRNVYVSGQWWSNSELGIVQIFGQNDNGAGDFSSNIELVADDQAGETSGRISVYNTANGGTVNETVWITSNNGGGGWVDLRDNTSITTISLDGQNGNISANGDVSGNTLTSSDGMVQTSDRRLKTNIASLENALEKTLEIRGVSYTWKDEQKSQRNQIGVIAQELEEVYPEFVHTNDEGMKAVNYAQITAVLIEAIKELNAKVENLEDENSSLKASLEEVKALRSEMDQLVRSLGSSKAASK